jgi:hypothetical protein
MATWLILVVAALVLAVIGMTAEATWLFALAAIVLVLGIVVAVAGRSARASTSADRGGR